MQRYNAHRDAQAIPTLLLASPLLFPPIWAERFGPPRTRGDLMKVFLRLFLSFPLFALCACLNGADDLGKSLTPAFPVNSGVYDSSGDLQGMKIGEVKISFGQGQYNVAMFDNSLGAFSAPSDLTFFPTNIDNLYFAQIGITGQTPHINSYFLFKNIPGGGGHCTDLTYDTYLVI